MRRGCFLLIFIIGLAHGQDSEALPEDPAAAIDTDFQSAPDFFSPPETPERPDVPQTFEEAVELFTNGQLRDNSTEGFNYGIRIRETYNSNPRISEDNASGVFFTSLSPSFSYRSAPRGQAVLVLGASYNPRLNFYHGEGFGDNVDHQFRGTATYEGAKTWLTFGTRFWVTHDSNRLVGDFARDSNLGVSLSVRHEWSPITRFTGQIDYNERENNVSLFGNSSTLSASAAALWEVTPLVQLGPSIRYAAIDSDSTGSFESLGFSLRMDYDYTEKTNLSFTLGGEFVSSDSPGFEDDFSPAASLRVDYDLSDIWTLRFDAGYEAISIEQLRNREVNQSFQNDPFSQNAGSLGSGEQFFASSLNLIYAPSDQWEIWTSLRQRKSPSFINDDETVEDLTWSAGARRFFGLSHLALTYSKSNTDFINNSGFGGRAGENYDLIFLTYSHPSLFDEISISTNISHSRNSGGRSFEQTTASVSLGYRF